MNTHSDRFARGPCRATLLLVFFALSAAGCGRAFYRHEADREVYRLVDRAAADPRWPLEGYTIRPRHESRMYDPYSPDCPPMPPDDPTSHRLMHCVDCKRGWPCWGCYGKTRHVDSPAWEAYLPRDEHGAVVLDREAAVQLALIHSRDYQQQLENLYLSALDVTFQRFRLDAQFFGGNSTFFTADGRDRAGGQSQSRLNTDTNFQMRKLLAGGGELVVGMANSLVWQFAGPDQYSGTTLLDFSLVQPLLRAGGRAVVLEQLTGAERALLANIRQMERFRRGFYAQVAAGRNAGPGPGRGGVGLGTVDPGSTGGVGGLLRLLQQQVQIRNQKANAVALRDSLQQLKAFYEAGQLESRFQVEQARLRLFNAQISLLNLKTAYDDNLDTYKIRLGLPPQLEVRIDDPLLEHFDLIDPKLTEAQEAVTGLLGKLRDPPPDDRVSHHLATLGSTKTVCRAQLEVVRRDMQSLVEALPARRNNLRQLAAREEFQRGDVDPSIYDVGGLERRVAKLKEDFARLDEELKATLDEVGPFQEAAEAAAVDTAESEPDRESLREEKLRVVNRLSAQLLELSLMQAQARLDSITLQPLDLAPEKALTIARANRRDWMNARAGLVDAWRQIELAANDLESDLDLTFSGDLGTIGDNPVRFRGTNGRLRVGLEFDAPLARLAERNAYREELIAYQQARRAYYAFEDRVDQNLRSTLRAIRLNQLNFEQRRAAVFVAIIQVDLKQYDLLHKPPPASGQALGATTARDVVDALNDLLDEQNNFLSVWVEYEAQRLALDLDLGTMRLDSRGMWIDPGSVGSQPDDTQEEQPPDRLEEVPLPEPIDPHGV